jgi:hypothetical protein
VPGRQGSGEVRKAVTRDLKVMPGVKDSALAASALALADEMDSPNNSATSKSMCAKELRETMATLRGLAPPAEKPDRLDDLSARRVQRRRRATA